MENTGCLFVGGPWDGRRYTIDPQADIVNATPTVEADATLGNVATTESVDTSVRYRREKLSAPGREWSVFVAPEIGPGDVIARLLDGYNPR